MEFEDYLKEYAKDFEPYIIKGLDDTRCEFENAKHHDLDKYLYDPFRNYLSNSGKLHRPLTCIAAYRACGGNDIDRVMPVARSIEYFQAEALIHDDIADGAELRRSKPCLHITEGEGLAINIGDMGLSMVFGTVIDDKPEILKELTRMVYTTIEGQAMDLGWAKDNRYDISEDDYLCMATKKTAYYSLAQPCVLGSLCANYKDYELFRDFGLKLGLAFQLKDDLLNIVGSAKDKDFRSDIEEGKRTLILIKTIENVGQDILREDINTVADTMISCGAIDYVNDMAIKLAEEAREKLDNIPNLNGWKEVFYSMCEWVIKRGA